MQIYNILITYFLDKDIDIFLMEAGIDIDYHFIDPDIDSDGI